MDPNEQIGNISMLEYPFVYPGITYGEYWKERDYFIHHYEDYKKGTYVPLWKQKKAEGSAMEKLF